ncbi:MAG: carboxypeptidase regulatory-like domain-containing protein [Bacteroidales bacterium]|nr:carboxypeptidase regulatory-like domain-containing protein [Bacteroidales bacterium]
MKRSIFIIFIVFVITIANGQDRVVVRIEKPENTTYKELQSAGYEITAHKPDIYIDVLVEIKELENLKNKGYIFSITQTEEQLKENLAAGTDLTGYRSYSDLVTELQNIQSNNPAICKLYDIGNSWGKNYSGTAYNNYKHDVWALKVSDNVETEEDEPCIFYFGAHHAREPISVEVAMYILNHIIDNYGTDPDITYSVNNKQIWFVPIVNPDGHKIVWDGNDTWWRKNIRDNDGNNQITSGTTDGVDPNRNYGWEWGGSGSSGSMSSETYRGPSAFSEPETQAVKNLMDQHHFVAGITYHSYSELVLYPYGYATGTTAPDNAALSELAVDMALTIPAAGGGHYTPQQSWQLYAAAGVTDDYAYGENGIFCYTIELATQFIPPSSQVPGICSDNLQAAKILLDRVDQSMLTGLVKDANTLQPVVAEVYIEGIDNTGVYREPYESNANFGRYYRLLTDGNYSVTFSAYGYIPQTFNNVNINSTGQTILNVNLVPAQTVTVIGTVTDQSTGLPIENATIEVLNTPISPVYTNQDGEYIIANIMEGTYDFRVYALNYATIVDPISVSTANTVFNFQLQESIAWSFESGIFEPQWTFGGSAPWFITTESPYDGAYCSRSGAIGDNQSSEMSITHYLGSGGDVSFFRKVSSEATYDFLKFYIDDLLKDSWSGELDWAEVSYPVSSGEHIFKWVYIKDANTIGGSDCAWVDYIIFPPIIPPPDPADIVLNPASFTESLTIGSTTNKQLTISNIGEEDLNFNAAVVYLAGTKSSATVYPIAANYNTGTTTSSSKTQTSLVRGYPPSECGWMKFDVSSIPDGATINSVEFHGYVNSTYYPYWSITPVSNDPFTTPASTLYSDIYAEASSGYYLYNNENSSYSTGWKTHTLGGNVNANLEAALAQNWFAIGILDRDNSSSYYINFDGWNEANKPYLVIDYTYSPPYTWLTLNGSNTYSGSVSSGDDENITVGFDASGLDEGIYYANISISSNDPDEPVVDILCTLNVVSGINLNLSAMLEGPFNGSDMNTALNNSGLIPLTQPFNTSPWNYGGDESVVSIPSADVVDWMLIELRETGGDVSTATAATAIARQAGFILKDGTLVNTEGNPVIRFDVSITNNLFVVLYHMNHLGLISSAPVVESGGFFSYDFSTGSGQALGGTDAQTQLATGIWGLIGGDANGDGDINETDKSDSWESSAGTHGHSTFDINLDGEINNLDKDDFWFMNMDKHTFIPE